jgi:hypothetical protein
MRGISNKIMKPTIAIYRSTISYLVSGFDKELETIESATKGKGIHARFTFVEKLIHGTGLNSGPKSRSVRRKPHALMRHYCG